MYSSNLPVLLNSSSKFYTPYSERCHNSRKSICRWVWNLYLFLVHLSLAVQPTRWFLSQYCIQRSNHDRDLQSGCNICFTGRWKVLRTMTRILARFQWFQDLETRFKVVRVEKVQGASTTYIDSFVIDENGRFEHVLDEAGIVLGMNTLKFTNKLTGAVTYRTFNFCSKCRMCWCKLYSWKFSYGAAENGIIYHPWIHSKYWTQYFMLCMYMHDQMGLQLGTMLHLG